MGDPLSVAAAVTGLVVPALHAIRLLLDDVEKIIDAPKTVESLKDDLAALVTTLDSLQAIKDTEWASLGDTVAKQSQSSIKNCQKACETFSDDLKRWTKRSPGGKLSWRDRAKIGFFKEEQIKAIFAHLQSCKLTCSNVVTVATLYSSLRNTHITEDVKKAVAEKEAGVAAAAQITDTRLTEVETSLAKMRLVDVAQQDESESDDLMSAVSQLEEELAALKSSQRLLPELLSRTKMEEIRKIVEGGQGSSTRVSFGDHNQGVQVGVNQAPISWHSNPRT